MVYIFISFDNWPELARPILSDSYWYLLYYVPFVLVNMFFFFPIPIAVLFDSFRVSPMLTIFLRNKGEKIFLTKTCTRNRHSPFVSTASI
jgi:hypothetical protein